MSTVKTLITAGLLALAALTVPGTAVASPDTAPRGYGNCGAGNFCLYPDWDGGGAVCRWTSERVDNTADACQFVRQGKNVRSVWNNTNHRKQYYTGTNCDKNSRVGSTESGKGGNLKGTYLIWSFQKQG